MGISYSDGDESEVRIRKLIEASPALDSESSPAASQYLDWAVRYHLCPERSNLFRHFDFTGLDVLELGAGMGGVSRFLAEKAAHLEVVEGTERRFDALRARLKGLTNWKGQIGNLDSVELDRKFDVVCVVGVLEYSEIYVRAKDGLSPFQVFLKTAARHLKPDGALLLAIENRLGLKYWSGAAEDHTGRLFDGICGYPPSPTPRTFSRRELNALLADAGLPVVQEYFPFPDYKVPTTVLTPELCELAPEAAADLATTHPFENYGAPRARYFPDVLAAHSLSEAGLLPEFANSFLFLSAVDPDSPVVRKLRGRELADGECGWHYSMSRERVTRTAFRRDGRVTKGLLSGTGPAPLLTGDLSVRWKGGTETLHRGGSLRKSLCRHAYYGDWAGLRNALVAFLRWSKGREGLDAIFVNAVVDGDGYRLFDQEWSLDGKMSESWFVLRNVLALWHEFSLFSSDAPFANLKEFYESLCRDIGVTPDLEADVDRESRFQNLVSNRKDLEEHRRTLRAAMEKPFPPRRYPRSPAEEARLRQGGVRTTARALGREIKRKAREWLA